MLNQDEENIISYCARLVYKPNPHLDLEDFLQEGRLIAIKARPSYNPDKAKWLTYLRTCVYNGLCRLANKNPPNPYYPSRIVPLDPQIPESQKNPDILIDCFDILTTEEYNAVVGSVVGPKTDKEYRKARKTATEKLKKYGQI